MSARAVEVLETGPQALVEDDGRTGHLAVGVGRSGAADRASHRLGQRLVGNPPDAAGVEVTLGGLRVRAHGDLVVCLTGAPAPAVAAGRPAGHASLVRLADGEELALGMPPCGLRTYLAVRGGIAVPAVLGSRSSDTMSGLGPEPLTPGTTLPVGDPPDDWSPVDQAPAPPVASGEVVLEVTAGPRRDWFADPEALAATAWQVSDRSDRKGVRLTGPGLVRSERTREQELPSEGMVRGAIQVPPGGEPVVLLTDHPVTGGYPVIGVVRPDDVDRAAQLVPGQAVRLRWREPGDGR